MLALTALLSAQRRDKSFDVHQARNKRPVVRRSGDLGFFQACLTPFAFKAVEAQAEQMQKVELNHNGSEYTGLTYSGRRIVPILRAAVNVRFFLESTCSRADMC